MIREICKSEEDIKQREKSLMKRGYWMCDKCLTKYYAGMDCHSCMLKELAWEIYNEQYSFNMILNIKY